MACASEGVEPSPASRVQILSGHYNTAGRVPLPLQLRESEMFDLGSVPYKDSDELMDVIAASNNHENGPQTGGETNIWWFTYVKYRPGHFLKINTPKPSNSECLL
jgi:hypothetical protein